MASPNCDIGYHCWKRFRGYWECVACHLVERTTDSGREDER